MKEIHYMIRMLGYWHCGSGQAAGADVDALVIKDKDGLPFIPGKTLKGLVRQAFEEIAAFKGESSVEGDRLFGIPGGAPSKTYFTDAQIVEKDEIIKDGLSEWLYQTVSMTEIDSNTGTASDLSLRKIEVVVPCTLKGSILFVEDGSADKIKDALRYIKAIGLDRNRGLGRCSFENIDIEEEN